MEKLYREFKPRAMIPFTNKEVIMYSKDSDDKMVDTLEMYVSIGSQANLLKLKFVYRDATDAWAQKLVLQCLEGNTM